MCSSNLIACSLVLTCHSLVHRSLSTCNLTIYLLSVHDALYLSHSLFLLSAIPVDPLPINTFCAALREHAHVSATREQPITLVPYNIARLLARGKRLPIERAT